MGFGILLLLPAVVLAGLGWWGRSDADSLVPAWVSASDREHRVQVLRRGALCCYVAAATLAVAAVLSAL